MKLLNDSGTTMNHKKNQRIMKKCHLFVKIRRRNPYKDIAKKTQEHRICDNKLNREFKQTMPPQVFCTDITYLFFNNRLACLSVIYEELNLQVEKYIEYYNNERYQWNLKKMTSVGCRNHLLTLV